MRARYPLRRSLVFWMGLWVMGFILWSWWESGDYRTMVGAGEYELIARDSGVALVRHGGFSVHSDYRGLGMAREMRLATPGFLQWQQFDYPKGIDVQRPADPALQEYADIAVHGWSPIGAGWLCFVPHWLLLVGVMILWAGLLGWRVRRWKRMTLVPEVEIREGEKR